MRKTLTIIITILSHTVLAQNAKTIEFRNIPGRLVNADNSAAKDYIVNYYGTKRSTTTDINGKFDINVPISVPVLLKIFDHNKLVFFYKVNPQEKVVSIKIDEKTLKLSEELLLLWNKDKDFSF